MIFVSFNSDMTGSTTGAVTADSYRFLVGLVLLNL